MRLAPAAKYFAYSLARQKQAVSYSQISNSGLAQIPECCNRKIEDQIPHFALVLSQTPDSTPNIVLLWAYQNERDINIFQNIRNPVSKIDKHYFSAYPLHVEFPLDKNGSTVVA